MKVSTCQMKSINNPSQTSSDCFSSFLFYTNIMHNLIRWSSILYYKLLFLRSTVTCNMTNLKDINIFSSYMVYLWHLMELTTFSFLKLIDSLFSWHHNIVIFYCLKRHFFPLHLLATMCWTSDTQSLIIFCPY